VATSQIHGCKSRRHARARERGIVVAGLTFVAVLLTAVYGSAAASAAYVNPLRGDRYVTGRTDMGVDFCLTAGAPIRAVGDGVVTGIIRNWYRHQPYLWYRLTDGAYAGRYVYVAEQITNLPRGGTYVYAGQRIATYKRSGTCIEMGWSAGSGWTLAHVTSGYREGQITPAGVSFARFLMLLGVNGRFELKPTLNRSRRAK
jgi:murein DD-endopeptidase MepM/ murein hydrolase activator NlpD